jgi:hypothetical protein
MNATLIGRYMATLRMNQDRGHFRNEAGDIIFLSYIFQPNKQAQFSRKYILLEHVFANHSGRTV